MTDSMSGKFDDGISSLSSQFASRSPERFYDEGAAPPEQAPDVPDVSKLPPRELLLPAIAVTMVGGEIKLHTSTSRRATPPLNGLNKLVPRWLRDSPQLLKLCFIFCILMIGAAVVLIIVSSLEMSKRASLAPADSDSPSNDFLAEIDNQNRTKSSSFASPTLAPTPFPSDRIEQENLFALSTESPTSAPTVPTLAPTRGDTPEPTATKADTNTATPTATPTKRPTSMPTKVPSAPPTKRPTMKPSPSPTNFPTARATTVRPTMTPTRAPTSIPSRRPISPTTAPTPWRLFEPSPWDTDSPVVRTITYYDDEYYYDDATTNMAMTNMAMNDNMTMTRGRRRRL